MLKKTLAALGLAGLLVLGGASAGFAEPSYPPPPGTGCSANPSTIAPGGSTTITCAGFMPESTVTFTATAGTLSSIVHAAGAGVPKTADAQGVATAGATASATGTVTVTASGIGPNEAPLSFNTTYTVAAAGTGGLPTTGGEVPTAAIWLGIGALGIGGIAVTAAIARRRASNNR